MQTQWRISEQYIGKIVVRVMKSIINRMMPVEMPTPTMEMLKESAMKFGEKWNYPNAIAAIDGKHVRIKCPGKSGSLFFNYKEYFSVVLLALVDADCKFIAVDVGSYGREGDAGR